MATIAPLVYSSGLTPATSCRFGSNTWKRPRSASYTRATGQYSTEGRANDRARCSLRPDSAHRRAPRPAVRQSGCYVAPGTGNMVRLENVINLLRRKAALQGPELARGRHRPGRPGRGQRLRQDHAPAPHRGRAGSRQRARHAAPRGRRYGYLPQEELTLSGRTLFDEVLTVFGDLSRIEDRMRELEHEMASAAGRGRRLHDRVHARVRAPSARVRGRGTGSPSSPGRGGPRRPRVRRERPHRLTEEFSGGWQMRIALAKLLLVRADRAAARRADQPPRPRVHRLARGLPRACYPGAVVLVSHDRSFLDRVVSRISELGVEGLVDYHGGYASFQVQREKRRETLAATRDAAGAADRPPPAVRRQLPR